MVKKKTYVKNASDAKQVKEARELEKRDDSQQIDDLKKILKSEYGKRFIWKLLGDCGVFRTSFDTSGSIVYFNEGKRVVGLNLLSQIQEALPEALLDMMKQNGENDNE